MYTVVGRKSMTSGDIQFMKEMGLDPWSVDGPFPRPLPPPPHPEATIPKLTEEDEQWLQNLGVMWEQDPEPDFEPPSTLREYLVRYPNGVRGAAEAAAKELGLDLSDDDLDDLAQDIIVMSLDFAVSGLEDIVEMYAFHPPVRPGGCRSRHFHEYVRLRVLSIVLAMLETKPTGTDDFRESLGL
jgi:hypothetical protein